MIGLVCLNTEPPASCTNPSTLSHLHPNTNFYHHHLCSHCPRTMQHLCSLLSASENKRLLFSSPFLEKRWHWIFHQWMLLIYEQSKFRIPWWGCQDLLDSFVHADWFCQDMVWLHRHINIQETTIILKKWWATKRNHQKFGDTDKRTTQSLKIRTIQQGDRSADKHVQEFEKAALEAGYEGYPLVVEFKCSLNSGLRRRLMKLWPMPMTIQQWYDKAIMMDHQ